MTFSPWATDGRGLLALPGHALKAWSGVDGERPRSRPSCLLRDNRLHLRWAPALPEAPPSQHAGHLGADSPAPSKAFIIHRQGP